MPGEHVLLENVQPRIEDFVTRDDSLVFDYVGLDTNMEWDNTNFICLNPSTVAVDVRYVVASLEPRLMANKDNWKWENRQHTVILNGNGQRFVVPLISGYLVYLSISVTNYITPAAGIGQNVSFVAARVGLQRQGFIYRALLSDSIPPNESLTYPPERIRDYTQFGYYPMRMEINTGLLVVGDNISIQTFRNVEWRIQTFFVEFTTDATVAIRRINLTKGIAGEYACLEYNPFTQAPSLVQTYVFCSDLSTQMINQLLVLPVVTNRYIEMSKRFTYDWRRDGIVLGAAIRTETDNFQIGDQFTGCIVYGHVRPVKFDIFP
jgi:hypothetical protein